MKMNELALKLRCPCSESCYCVHSLEVAVRVVFCNEQGWQLCMVCVSVAYDTCPSGTCINDEGDGESPVLMHDVHPIG